MTAWQERTAPWRPHKRPHILALLVLDGLLWAERADGLSRVFCFAPLYLAHQCGQCVPFASQWPEHLKPFVYRYDPLPAEVGLHLPPDLAEQFGRQTREGSGLRPWTQLLFRGWPLYLLAEDAPSGKGEAPGLFELAWINLPELPMRSDHGSCGP